MVVWDGARLVPVPTAAVSGDVASDVGGATGSVPGGALASAAPAGASATSRAEVNTSRRTEGLLCWGWLGRTLVAPSTAAVPQPGRAQSQLASHAPIWSP